MNHYGLYNYWKIMYKCILHLKSRRPYLAEQLGHVLDMGDLLGLAVVQAARPGLVSLHAVLDLRRDNAVRPPTPDSFP